ncbi:hypothetical protein QBC37DRAFT_466982 [Rhypophila decipiens]|uniref:C2H2-type domain-containing protein n=1 Tax=Rhypophila decipiens TaxID=261697 RepID=A0AAN6Y5Q8_9PEZI|nr:hypothetical protein QBC37DRAFT_466982 [Rhypophila decipiens]
MTLQIRPSVLEDSAHTGLLQPAQLDTDLFADIPAQNRSSHDLNQPHGFPPDIDPASFTFDQAVFDLSGGIPEWDQLMTWLYEPTSPPTPSPIRNPSPIDSTPTSGNSQSPTTLATPGTSGSSKNSTSSGRRRPKKHSCDFPGCDYKCALQKDLAKHQIKHYGLDPATAFECPRCGKLFRQDNGRRHYKTVNCSSKPSRS